MFYNTINETDETLAESRKKAARQEQVILHLFKRYTRLTPTIVYTRHFIKGDPPITSIRRAFTDLTKSGQITKTDLKQKGMYGKNEHVWEIVTNQVKIDFR